MYLSDQYKLQNLGGTSNGAVVTMSDSIDLLGYDYCSFVIATGATANGSAFVQVSDDKTTWQTVNDQFAVLKVGEVSIIDTKRLDRRYARLQISPNASTQIVSIIAALSGSIGSETLPYSGTHILRVANKPSAS